MVVQTSNILGIQCVAIPVQTKGVLTILIISGSLVQEVPFFVCATFVSDEFVDAFDLIVHMTKAVDPQKKQRLLATVVAFAHFVYDVIQLINKGGYWIIRSVI